MADPVSLTALTPGEAVADALYRCVRGLDTNDWNLFESSCLKDESMTVVAGDIILDSWVAIREFFFQRVFVLVTTHLIGNIRVEMTDGADTASMTAQALAYHIRPEEAFSPKDTSYAASCLYFIDLVRDSNDGLWKINKWELRMLWSTGNRAVFHG